MNGIVSILCVGNRVAATANITHMDQIMPPAQYVYQIWRSRDIIVIIKEYLPFFFCRKHVEF